MAPFVIRKKAGFTLLELIVAVGVFSVIATTAIGALLVLLDAEEKARNVQTNQDNIRFALETIGREIRTGTDYRLLGLGNPQDPFQFLNVNGEAIVYKRSEDSVECNTSITPVSCIVKSTDGSAFSPVTSPETRVDRLEFHIFGTLITPGEPYQPRVVMILEGVTPGSVALRSEIDIQTSISQLKTDTTSP